MRNENRNTTNPELFPFVSRHFTQPHGAKQAYLDEGSGEPVVMVHGNPTWSFYFRTVVAALRGTHRCLVPDHVGCGRSDKPTPDGYDFSLQSRIDDLDRLLEHAGVTDKVTLVCQDWGGMIGLSWAARHPERIKRLMLTNTGGFPLPRSKRFPWSLRLGRNTSLGAWLILKRNLFCTLAAKWCVTRKPLAPEVRAMYLAPHDTPERRISVLKFVQTIPLSPRDAGWDIITNTAESLERFRSVPTLLLWGMKDFVFDRHFLKEFQRRLPHAETHTWPDCGNYLLEDAPEEAILKLTEFMAKHP